MSSAALLAQLTQNGADVYEPGLQLPRYIVSQECLAGYDGGPIYIAPPIPTVPFTSAFPQPVNLGNSWDAALVREVASAISDEARAAWTHLGRPSLTCMSPNLNIARDPRWGRNVESFGEDPSLVAVLGAAYVRGLQEGLPGAVSGGYLKTFAMPKHLGAYSVECFNASGGPNDYPNCPVCRADFNAVVDDTDLRHTYLPAWEAAVAQASASGVMCSYNAINGAWEAGRSPGRLFSSHIPSIPSPSLLAGVPACANGGILKDVLVGEWGLQGPVISDADAVAQAGPWPPAGVSDCIGHRYTASFAEAAMAGFVNGTTVSLEDDAGAGAMYHTYLPAALAAGNISLAQVRAAAARALLPRFRAGLYDPPERVPWSAIPASVIDGEAAHDLARRAAAESYVLLRNANATLPLAPAAEGGPASIAVVGPAANCTGCAINRYSGHPSRATSAWDGIAALAAALGTVPVYGGAGGPAAVAAVASASVGVVVLTGEAEGESKDRQALGLPPDQAALLAALLATGTPLVLVVYSGGAVDVAPALDAEGGGAAAAVLFAHQGGMEAGAALADVLWGVVNPSGCLAATAYRASWAAASDFLDMGMRTGPGRGYRYLTPAAAAAHVLAPFGAGLSYTTWAAAVTAVEPASRIVSAAALAAGTTVNITVAITNTGARPGSRVVQLFLSRQGAGPPEWPRAWLPAAGFSKVHSVPAAGGRTTVQLAVAARDVSLWTAAQHAYVVQPGTYTLTLRDADAASPPVTLTVTP